MSRFTPMVRVIEQISLSLLVVLFLLSFVSSCNFRRNALIKQGNDVVAKVEQFKKEKGRLPDSLTELGITEKMEGPIYYDRKTPTEYEIWFGEELGHSVVYNSGSKKWRDQY